jgi:hypothetical protein
MEVSFVLARPSSTCLPVCSMVCENTRKDTTAIWEIAIPLCQPVRVAMVGSGST